ncbi:hypothetical protein PHMEG_00022175 [Phytophthora megakarya]|uniref:Uncharacterized protein n=1 Tax=Phytophthora megakarya TaxID=4795 RepID=A0A225VLE8_9STRA|nr:hypothetical protein PHMEG_00022175 [Phytophthora megakarya]
MTQEVKKKLDRQSPQAPEQKRVRLSPPTLPQVSAASLPPLPPLRHVAPRPTAGASEAPIHNTQKLAELRRKYLNAIAMVIQELKAVLTYGPGSASAEAPVSPSVVLKLVRTVQTLEKLHGLLLMNPTRLRKVSMVQLQTVEHQIKTNLLPLATLFRSLDGETGGKARKVSLIGEKMELEWNQSDTESPRSPSGVAVAPLPHDWRFLSIALSLQL